MSEETYKYPKSPGSLRPSQIVTTFGPGSIVQMSDDSVLIMGLQAWPKDKNNYKILHHPFLEKILDKDEFRMPISVDNKRIIPCISFPQWGVCNFCGRLQKHNDAPAAGQGEFHCQKCKNQLYHARFIVMCDAGHLDEFPWIEWAHKDKNFQSCKPDPVLRFYSTQTSQGLSDYKVKCMDCGESANLGNATSKGGILKIIPKCRGNSPWLDKFGDECKMIPRGIQTRSSSVYFSSSVSAIYIKKWLNSIQRKIDEHYDEIKSMIRNNIDVETIAGFDFFDEILKNQNSGFSKSSVISEIKRRFESASNVSTMSTELKIRDEEFQDLIKTEDDFKSEGDELQLTTIDISNDSLSKHLDHLKQINRITEIRVIRGFTRGEAPDPFSAESNDIERCKISSTRQKWYPAVENRGEGIFFTLNEKKLQEWESKSKVESRCNAIITGFEQWAAERGWKVQEKFKPRYLLLHTLAHMMIRELSISSGYNAASIRERIYRSDGYNGIILYTATPSADGSLGGLVRLGKLNHFKSLIHNTIAKSDRCSRDPFCSEDDPEKKAGAPSNTRLNGSACYACSLIPETSCENSNRLLDRKLLYDKELGFFNDVDLK